MNEKIEKIKERFELKNDAEIARFLDVQQVQIQRARDGKASILVKLKILDKLGYMEATKCLKMVLPEKAWLKYLAMERYFKGKR